MTREEEITKAADVNWMSDDTCLAFEDGAKWADEHPKSPWISVEDELPEGNVEVLGYFGIGVWSDGTKEPVFYLCSRRNGRPFACDEYGFELRGVDLENGDTEMTGPKYWMHIPKISKEGGTK